MSTPNELGRPNETSRAEKSREESEPSSSAIRAEIERTRGRLGETVEALGAQLNPTHLKQRVKDGVREATIGRVQDMASNTRDRISETSRGLAQTIRDNPLPAAMAATGIGWLLFNNRDRGEGRRYARRFADEGDESYRRRQLRAGSRDWGDEFGDEARDLRAGGHEVAREFGEEVGERARELRSRARDWGEDVGERAREYRASGRDLGEEVRERGRDVRETAKDVAGAVSEKAHDLKEQASDTAHRVAERARETRERVMERARDARSRIADTASSAARRTRETAVNTAHRVEDKYRETPIGMGALALAAGLAVGFALRSSRHERGELRENLMDRARDRIANAGDRIEGAIDRGVGEARSFAREASEEGLGG